MRARSGRILVVLLGMAAVFAAVATIMLRVIPEPHRETDYLVAGTVATFASLLTLFLVALKRWIKRGDVFSKPDKK